MCVVFYLHVFICYVLLLLLLYSSLILPLPQNVIDYLLDDGTLVVSGRYEATDTLAHTLIINTLIINTLILPFSLLWVTYVRSHKWRCKYHVKIQSHLRVSSFGVVLAEWLTRPAVFANPDVKKLRGVHVAGDTGWSCCYGDKLICCFSSLQWP